MPTVTMFAGPNGSGKSTLTAHMVEQGIEFGEYLNADDIAAKMVNRNRSVSQVEQKQTGPNISQDAQVVVRELRSAALSNRVDHCFETVMSHRSHIEHMRKARGAGFETRLFFVATENPLINVGRVANRVLNGGHDVPTDRIVARYHRCLDNLPEAIAAADYCRIFDNSDPARPLRLLAKIVHGSIHHVDVDGDDVPAWWLAILLKLKARNFLEDGPLDL